MTTEEWIDAFNVLHDLGVDFHLLLGNELLMKEGIVEIMDYLTNTLKVRYAFHTTSPPQIAHDILLRLIDIGITNVSSGVDILPSEAENALSSSIAAKSYYGYKGLVFCRDNGVQDIHGTITASKLNQHTIPALINLLTGSRMWIAFNTLHWAQDDGYDFFPPRTELEHLTLSEQDIKFIADDVLWQINEFGVSMQNAPEYFEAWKEYGAALNWHCNLPVILTVDADGSMRACGYRKGTRCSNMHILRLDLANYWQAWEADQKECPGCFWGFPWQAEFYDQNDREFGKLLFQIHANKYFGFKGGI